MTTPAGVAGGDWLQGLADDVATRGMPADEAAAAVRAQLAGGDRAAEAHALGARARAASAEALGRGEAGRALVWADLATVVAECAQDVAGLAEGLVLDAVAALALDSPARAGRALDTLSPLLENPSVAETVRANAIRCRGSLALAVGETEAGIVWLDQAVQRYDEMGLAADAAACARDLGVAYSRLGNAEAALPRLEAAMAGFEAVDRPVEAARTRYLLGHLDLDRGRATEAAEAFRACGEVFRSQGVDAYEAHAALSLAQAHYMAGKADEALSLARTADAQYRRLGLTDDMHRCRMLVAAVHIDQGRHDDADVLLRQAMAVFVRDRLDVDVARCRVLKGLSFLDQGRPEDAAALLEKAAALLANRGCALDAARALYAASEAEASIGQTEAAEASRARSLDIFRALGVAV
jgi:tetratricopeptide (TPR) repeat protein